MSLFGTLNIGSTALAAQTAAIQTTGNNISNASNEDYTRETAQLTENRESLIAGNTFIGNGVSLSGISRQVDDALNARLNSATADNQSATTASDWLGRVESTFNALSGDDLSTQLSTFYKSWSDLANDPTNDGDRQVVLQNGESTASWFNSLSSQLSSLNSDANSQITGLVKSADGLASQIASLNSQVVVAEGSTQDSTANSLRDQRDSLVKSLSKLINVSTIQQPDGSVNVYVGSEPLVIGASSRGVSGKTITNSDGTIGTQLTFTQNGGTMSVTSGEIGGLISAQQQVQNASDQVDKIAGNLVFELNKLHSSGQGTSGFSSVTSTNVVADPTAALNSTAAGLLYPPTNGSFVVHVKDKTTGQETSTLVQVDLDGLNGNDTTLNSLQASLAAVGGVTANVSGGRLQIGAANSNSEITFSQDSSGTLASLGINTFFSGTTASSMKVNSVIANDPTKIAAAKNGASADNQTALAISKMQDVPVTGLNGQSITDSYGSLINKIAVTTSAAKSNVDATQTVVDTLSNQRAAISGVSLDEEAVNLMKQQRAYQAAARLVSTVDQLMQTLLAIG